MLSYRPLAIIGINNSDTAMIRDPIDLLSYSWHNQLDTSLSGRPVYRSSRAMLHSGPCDRLSRVNQGNARRWTRVAEGMHVCRR